MGHRQKGKGKKRKRSWHRGGVESKAWLRLPERLRTRYASPDRKGS